MSVVQEQMSFLPLVRIWIWVSVLASIAGWLLSALGQLNRVGYGIFLILAAGGLWFGRYTLSLLPPGRLFNGRKLLARFRRWLPACFLGLMFLVFIGSVCYPPTTHEAMSCRVPRVLHWLSEGRWHWIHTPNIRMNNRPCGLEWLSAPLLLFTRSDRGLFLINFIPLLLMPGLVFSMATRLGVRPRVAWHWMWLLPTGYNFLLQGGSLGNDTTPAFYALVAVDFGLRAWASRRPGDLWMSILSASLLTGAKVSNLPLLLPWAIVVIPVLGVLLRRPAATALLILLAASVSLLPTALLNSRYCGDWTGLRLEHAVTAMKQPVVGIWGNALLLMKNLVPPFFPAAKWWNQSALSLLPHAVADPMVANFETGFYTLGELPVEDTAGLGFGVSWLLAISIVAGWWIRLRKTRNPKSEILRRSEDPNPNGSIGNLQFPRSNWRLAIGTWQLAIRDSGSGFGSSSIPPRLRLLALIAPWLSLLAYFMKVALMDLPRHISAYYTLLAPMLLIGAGQTVIVRRRWWRALALGVMLLAALVLVVTPGRPLWPAQTVLSRLVAWKPDQPQLKRALTVYSVYGVRSDPLSNVRALLPPGLKVVGFMGTADDIDISLWRPFGSRRVKHILLSDLPGEITGQGIEYAVVGEVNLLENKMTLADWLRETGAELVATATATVTVSQGPCSWYVVRFLPTEGG